MTLTILPIRKLIQATFVSFSIDYYFCTHREEYKGNFKIIIFSDIIPVLTRLFRFFWGWVHFWYLCKYTYNESACMYYHLLDQVCISIAVWFQHNLHVVVLLFKFLSSSTSQLKFGDLHNPGRTELTKCIMIKPVQTIRKSPKYLKLLTLLFQDSAYLWPQLCISWHIFIKSEHLTHT